MGGHSSSSKNRSVYSKDAGLHIFTNKCRNCGGAFSVNVKDLRSGRHSVTVFCPHCGVKQTAHYDK